MSVQAQFPDEQNDKGEFQRQEDAFRDWVSNEKSAEYPVESGRYHLYVSYACPWAHRTLICRSLLGLKSAIGVSTADPVRDDRGWAFREGEGHGPDEANGFKFLSEAYRRMDAGYQGRVTVPVLWDLKKQRIVNNSEDDICRMMNDAFAELAGTRDGLDLFPPGMEREQRALSDQIYETVNNGVYRAGFATTQEAYEEAFHALFDTLDKLDQSLTGQRYLFGKRPVETDWRLFCTLVRFDAVYHGHFKCNLRQIVNYPNLSGYLRDLYQLPCISETVNLDHIKRHYYVTHDDINPTRIVPLGPEFTLDAPHGRDRL